MEQQARASQPEHRRAARTVALPAIAAVLTAVLTAALVAGCGGRTGSPRHDPLHARASSAGREAASTTTAPATTPPTTTTTAPTSTVPATVVPPTVSTTAVPGTRVVDVIDGDTVDVTGGERVRLIGIDAPERGECGFGEATAALRSLVEGKVVRLVPGARDDRDRYGRLLRYVEVDGLDANLEMIRRGLATARYDSRDGYGSHPRERDYVAADAASPSAPTCGPPARGVAPMPSTTIAPPAGGGTDPRFRTCRDAIANGYGPYTRGVDPEYDWYRDADGDGLVCER